MTITKITLKVKSGPGVIIGITELQANNNMVDFSGIQFSDPGEYIISVIPSNNSEIEESEFKINVLPEEEVIPQNIRKEEEKVKPVEGSRPIITQITQPSIVLDPIEFDASANNDENTDIGTTLGFTPFIWYNGISIRTIDIKKLDLYHDGMEPKCTIVVRDTFGVINSPESTPLNNSKFELFLNSGSNLLKSIHLRFKIEINQKNKKGTNTITGTLDLNDYYKLVYETYIGTSFDTLKALSIKNGLGFNSNIRNTNDSMVWKRNKRGEDFSNFVMSHSYISDESFVLGYIDYYWCFNYVDIEKEWKRDISNDVGLLSTGFSSVDEDTIQKLSLTNDKSLSTTPFFFTNYRLNNNSTKNTTVTGRYTCSKVYDRLNKSFLKFNIDPIRSEGDDKIVLSGAPTEEQDNHYRSNYSGKIDLDNVHPNYLYAIDQNKRNLINLTNISITMDLPNPNFNLYKYQKVQLDFINQQQNPTNENLIDDRLTGEWIIIEIGYSWRNKGLVQKLTLVRKELGKTPNEINNQEVKAPDNRNNSEINENPVN